MNAITGGVLGMVLLFVGGAGIGGLLALAGLADRDVPALVGLLGSVASLARPATSFWGQLTGPRTAVRNPVLRESLAILDSLAELAPHLFGAVAIVVTGAPPQVPVLAALAGYGRACGEAIHDWFATMTQALGELAGPRSPLASLVRVFGGVGILLERFARLEQVGWAYLDVAATSIGSQAQALLSEWQAGLPGLGEILAPVINPLKAAGQAFSTVGEMLGRFWAEPSGPLMRAVGFAARTAAQGAAPAIRIARLLMGPPSPPMPPKPSLAGFGAILAPLQQPPAATDPLPMERLEREAVDAALKRLTRPTHVLGDVLAGPDRGRTGEDGDQAAYVADLATYLGMARRVVPPAIAGLFADLRGTLASLQGRRADLPVLAAPPAQRLRVQVGALRVRLPDAHAATGRAWSVRLRRATEMHAVTVPAVAPVAAAGAPGAR